MRSDLLQFSTEELTRAHESPLPAYVFGQQNSDSFAKYNVPESAKPYLPYLALSSPETKCTQTEPGAIALAPPEPGAIALAPPEPGAIALAPPEPGAIALAPPEPGAIALAPPEPGAIALAPPEPGAIALAPPEPGAIALVPVQPGEREPERRREPEDAPAIAIFEIVRVPEEPGIAQPGSNAEAAIRADASAFDGVNYGLRQSDALDALGSLAIQCKCNRSPDSMRRLLNDYYRLGADRRSLKLEVREQEFVISYYPPGLRGDGLSVTIPRRD